MCQLFSAEWLSRTGCNYLLANIKEVTTWKWLSEKFSRYSGSSCILNLSKNESFQKVQAPFGFLKSPDINVLSLDSMKYNFKCVRGCPGLIEIHRNFTPDFTEGRNSHIERRNVHHLRVFCIQGCVYRDRDPLKAWGVSVPVRDTQVGETGPSLYTWRQKYICKVFSYQTWACSTYSPSQMEVL